MNDYINALLNALQFFEIVPALLGTIAEKLTHSSTMIRKTKILSVIQDEGHKSYELHGCLLLVTWRVLGP